MATCTFATYRYLSSQQLSLCQNIPIIITLKPVNNNMILRHAGSHDWLVMASLIKNVSHSILSYIKISSEPNKAGNGSQSFTNNLK